MAQSGSGTLDTFLNLSYSGSGPDFRWRYAWSYAPATDSLTLTLALQGYCTNTGVTFGMRYRSSGKPWMSAACNGVTFAEHTALASSRHTVSGWQDILIKTAEITGTGGTAAISIRNYGQAVWGSTGVGTCDNTQSLTVKADRGLVRVYTSGAWHAALPYVYTGAAWHQSLPYVRADGEWKLSI